MLSSLESLLVFMAVASLAITWAFQGAVVRRLSRRKRPLADFSPPVSILKPLAGVDEGLLENLRSIASLDYPKFEIIFGVKDDQDAAVVVVQQIQQEFPQVPIRLICGSPSIGYNPKVNNLAGMAKHARYEYLLISDANVRVKPDYLRALAAEFSDPKVGLACNVIAGSHAQSMGALFEDLHLNTFIAAAVCGATELGNHPCVVGKSMLMRRKDFERLGGWGAVRNILAEDYVLGQRFHLAGWKVALSPHVVEAVHMRRTVREFVSRHVRWSQMRRRLVPYYYLTECLLNPTPWCFALLLAACQSLNRQHIVCAAAVVGLKCVGDVVVMFSLTGRQLNLWQVATIPFKDCLVGAIWAVGAFRRSVTWRGHAMRIGRGSVLYGANEAEPTFLLDADSPHGMPLM